MLPRLLQHRCASFLSWSDSGPGCSFPSSSVGMALDLGTEPIFESSDSGGDEPVSAPAPRPAARRAELEPDVGTESGGEEMTATQAAEGALKRRKWTGTEEVQRKWLTSTAKDIEIDRCAWDLQLCYGQTRALDEGHVMRLKASLEERPPTAPVRVCLWENSADRKFYFLSGQHIGRAVKKVSASSAGTRMCALTFSNLRRLYGNVS